MCKLWWVGGEGHSSSLCRYSGHGRTQSDVKTSSSHAHTVLRKQTHTHCFWCTAKETQDLYSRQLFTSSSCDPQALLSHWRCHSLPRIPWSTSSCCGPPSFPLSRLCSSSSSSLLDIMAWWDLFLIDFEFTDCYSISWLTMRYKLNTVNVNYSLHIWMNRMSVLPGMLKHLCSASVLSCGFGSSTAGEKATPACGLQVVTETPVCERFEKCSDPYSRDKTMQHNKHNHNCA